MGGRVNSDGRFRPADIRLITPHLQLHTVEYRHRFQCNAETALCIVLYRLSAPASGLKAMMATFRRSRTWLSIVFNDVVEHLIAQYRSLLFWDADRLTYAELQRYASAVLSEGGAQGLWGFVDGTMRVICQPDRNRRLYEDHSRRKKPRAIKYQVVLTPDGLVSHLAGPYMGRDGCWAVYQRSNLADCIRAVHETRFRAGNGDHDAGGHDAPGGQLFVYGDDSAYEISYGLISPYQVQPGQPLDSKRTEFNARLSMLRRRIERGPGQAMALWGYYNGYSKAGLGAGLSPVAAYFMVSVLLSNIHTCIYGNRTSRKFRCSPPSIEDYLHTVQ